MWWKSQCARSVVISVCLIYFAWKIAQNIHAGKQSWPLNYSFHGPECISALFCTWSKKNVKKSQFTCTWNCPRRVLPNHEEYRTVGVGTSADPRHAENYENWSKFWICPVWHHLLFVNVVFSTREVVLIPHRIDSELSCSYETWTKYRGKIISLSNVDG